MHNMGIIGGAKRPHPIGEVTLLAGGTWVCPPSVTKVCVVCVGSGGTGIQYPTTNSGGGGGALAYKNEIPVTPGQTYSFTVGSPSAIFGVSAGAGAAGKSSSSASPGGTASGGDANFSGGFGATGFGGTQAGGSAATYSSNGATGGSEGVGLYGTGSTGPYGRGGNSTYSGTAGQGYQGAIRIIWGANRAFPNNAQAV